MAAAMKSMHHCAIRMRIGADEMMCEAAAKMLIFELNEVMMTRGQRLEGESLLLLQAVGGKICT